MSPFVFQTISKHGTENPIVARLTMQANRFKGSYGDDEQTIFENVWDCQQRLLECQDARPRVAAGIANGIAASIAERRAGVKAIPYTIGLEADAGSFLISAKQYLHALAKTFCLILRARIRKAQDASIFWT